MLHNVGNLEQAPCTPLSVILFKIFGDQILAVCESNSHNGQNFGCYVTDTIQMSHTLAVSHNSQYARYHCAINCMLSQLCGLEFWLQLSKNQK